MPGARGRARRARRGRCQGALPARRLPFRLPFPRQAEHDVRQHLFPLGIDMACALHEDDLVFLRRLRVGADELDESPVLAVRKAVIGANDEGAALPDARDH